MGLTDRFKEKAADAVAVASEKAKDAAAAASDQASPRLRSLISLDDEQSMSPETFAIKLVEAIRSDADEELSAKDLKRRGKRRQRIATTAGALGGPAGLRIAGLYCEAAILCDVADVNELGLTDEQLAAHLLVLWEAMPDIVAADAAVAGTGASVSSYLGGKLASKLGLKLDGQMSKKDVVAALWKSRGVVEDVAGPDGAGPRDILLPGKRVKQLTSAAEAQLGLGQA